MSFALTPQHLQRLMALNCFPVPATEMVFVGLRGCLPVNPDDTAFAPSRAVTAVDPNYTTPRCTLVQWRVQDGTLATYPGSTVPHLSAVKAHKAGLYRANQLMTGYFDDYVRGKHSASKPSGHWAFRQTKVRPVLRTTDDLDYDTADRPEAFEIVADNLHAAWCVGLNSAYSSLGCSVVVGYPKRLDGQGKAEAGPWKAFKAAAYATAQDRFPYALLTGGEAARLAADLTVPRAPRVRYGARGDLGRKVQKALTALAKKTGKAHYDPEGTDSVFGVDMFNAVMAFQTGEIGPRADDGIVGPTTADALGIAWPTL